MPDQKTEKTSIKREETAPGIPFGDAIIPEDIKEGLPNEAETKNEQPPEVGKDFRMGATFESSSIVRRENDPRESIGNRILAYLESRNSGEFVRLNDFLKSLYPLPKLGHPPGFENVQNMRFLRLTLRQLKDDQKVVFANDSFDRLGKHYYEGSAPETKYHNVLTVPIEAKILQ